MTKAILLHSGGFDSTLVALYLRKERIPFVSLFLNLGQTAATAELSAVQKVCSKLDIQLDVISMPGFRQAFTSSEFSIFGNSPNPGNHVLALGSLTLLGVAAAYARKNGAGMVYVGYNTDDSNFSNEYSQKFLDMYGEAVSSVGDCKMFFIAPLLDNGLSIPRNDGSIFEVTYSCINKGPDPCGVCASCVRRVEKLESLDK